MARLIPSNRTGASEGSIYTIDTYIYGGNPPYTATIDWGDDSTDTTLSIVSGVQTFTITSDVSPLNGQTLSASHAYATKGTYALEYSVEDDPDLFGCVADISHLVSPFNVGSPPEIDLEVRLDSVTSYPSYFFTDIEAGYNFVETVSTAWTSAPSYHVLTQVHNTDSEDGKPREFSWVIDNSEGLIYQFYYEDITAASGIDVDFTAGSHSLSHDFIQQDSLVLKSTTGHIYEQDVDYTMNWVSGIISVVAGQSIADAEQNITAAYGYYAFMNVGDDITTMGESNTSQWTTVGTAVNSSIINLNTLGTPIDKNTVRFKVRSS